MTYNIDRLARNPKSAGINVYLIFWIFVLYVKYTFIRVLLRPQKTVFEVDTVLRDLLPVKYTDKRVLFIEFFFVRV